MLESDKNLYNLTVTNIRHIVKRPPNSNWIVSGFSNDTHHIIAYSYVGNAEYVINGKNYDINKGDIIFMPKGTFHSGKSSPDKPWGYYSVGFDTNFENLYSEKLFYQIPNVIKNTQISVFSMLLSELEDCWLSKRSGYTIRCRGLLMDIIFNIIQAADDIKTNIPHRNAIDKVLNKIHDNYERTYSVEELSDICDLSPSYFRMLFKKYTGYSVMQYQNRIKISKAKDLLLSGEFNVSETAVTLGFDDIYYFSRLFKKTTGMPPSDYIKG